jgi:cytochrome c-type biogenesis protein CcmH/NrfG
VKLRDVSPEEANVMFMLGKVYRIKGDLKESSRCFTAAVDLDPKLLPVVRQIQSSEGRDEVPGRDQSRDGDIEITEE